MVELAENPEREVVVATSGRMFMLLHTLAPALAERMLAMLVEKDHFQDRYAPPTADNLFTPMPEWTTASGGWKAGGGIPIGRLALGGLAAIGAALFAWSRLRADGAAE